MRALRFVAHCYASGVWVNWSILPDGLKKWPKFHQTPSFKEWMPSRLQVLGTIWSWQRKSTRNYLNSFPHPLCQLMSEIVKRTSSKVTLHIRDQLPILQCVRFQLRFYLGRLRQSGQQRPCWPISPVRIHLLTVKVTFGLCNSIQIWAIIFGVFTYFWPLQPEQFLKQIEVKKSV